jgi:hypothetical protein
MSEQSAEEKKTGPNEEEATGRWRNLHNDQFIICTLHHLILGRSNEEEWYVQGM